MLAILKYVSLLHQSLNYKPNKVYSIEHWERKLLRILFTRKISSHLCSL